jgi:hypothetical protein
MNLLQKAKPILTQAVQTGDLDPFEVGKIESQLNKCVKYPALSLTEKYAHFFLKKLKAGRRQRQGTIS